MMRYHLLVLLIVSLLSACGGSGPVGEISTFNNTTSTSNNSTTSTSNGTTSTSAGTTGTSDGTTGTNNGTTSDPCGDGVCADDENCTNCPTDCACDTTGQEGGPCYPNATCDAGLVCEDGTCAELCGVIGEGCCEGQCGEGLVCDGGTCVEPCGDEGDACCAEAEPCSGGLSCREGLCVDTTGQEGGPCYPNATCDAGLACEGGACVATCEGDAPQADRGAGVCAGQVKVCDGVAWVEPDYAAILDYQADERACDGLDNDCDGQTDESGPNGEPCECDPGADAPRPCGSDVGQCQAGEQTCQEDGRWSAACVGAVEPVAETCNGLDDDCDGEADEGLAAPVASLTEGVCAGQVQRCEGPSGWLDPVWSDLSGYEAEEASCDGLDNDCDGFTDEDLTSPPASQQRGVCEGATRVCAASGLRPCSTYEINLLGGCALNACGDVPQGELVDCVLNACGDVYSSVSGDCQSCAAANLSLPLQEILDTCSEADDRVRWLEPDYTAIPAYLADEAGACDGLDNDCDGEADEGCVCAPGEQERCGSEVGTCRSGDRTCSGQGQWGACVGEVAAASELCNGEDDDCDGTVDEGFGVGAACEVVGQQGICREGVRVCQTPGTTCAQVQDPRSETCDGLDEDCDGQVDNDGPWPSVDAYEPNNSPVVFPMQTSDSAVTRFEFVEGRYYADASFHADNDIDHYYNTFPSLQRPVLLCRVVMDVQMKVRLNVAFYTGSTLRFNETEARFGHGDLFVQYIPPIYLPPYRLDVVVSPVDGVSGCFSAYQLECKMSSNASW